MLKLFIYNIFITLVLKMLNYLKGDYVYWKYIVLYSKEKRGNKDKNWKRSKTKKLYTSVKSNTKSSRRTSLETLDFPCYLYILFTHYEKVYWTWIQSFNTKNDEMIYFVSLFSSLSMLNDKSFSDKKNSYGALSTP